MYIYHKSVDWPVQPAQVITSTSLPAYRHFHTLTVIQPTTVRKPSGRQVTGERAVNEDLRMLASRIPQRPYRIAGPEGRGVRPCVTRYSIPNPESELTVISLACTRKSDPNKRVYAPLWVYEERSARQQIGKSARPHLPLADISLCLIESKDPKCKERLATRH